MTKALAIMALVALGGCATLDPDPWHHELRSLAAGAEPSSHEVERQIRAYLSDNLKDPDSLKQFEIFFPLRKTRWLIGGGGAEEGWLVCFTYNAKNSYGGYVGARTHHLVFQTYPDG